MAKVNNAVRIVEFKTERDLYAQMENDLVSYFKDPDSRCYKLKNIQLFREIYRGKPGKRGEGKNFRIGLAFLA